MDTCGKWNGKIDTSRKWTFLGPPYIDAIVTLQYYQNRLEKLLRSGDLRVPPSWGAQLSALFKSLKTPRTSQYSDIEEFKGDHTVDPIVPTRMSFAGSRGNFFKCVFCGLWFALIRRQNISPQPHNKVCLSSNENSPQPHNKVCLSSDENHHG